MDPGLFTLTMALTERRIAEAAVVSDIECFGHSCARHLGARTWDVRAMTNPHEHCPHTVDMARQALAYAEWRGLVHVIERQSCGAPAVVRIVRDAD